MNVPVNENGSTFFVKHGDLISRGAIGLSILVVLWTIFAIITSGKNAKRI
jgi:hypothetical protein